MATVAFETQTRGLRLRPLRRQHGADDRHRRGRRCARSHGRCTGIRVVNTLWAPFPAFAAPCKASQSSAGGDGSRSTPATGTARTLTVAAPIGTTPTKQRVRGRLYAEAPRGHLYHGAIIILDPFARRRDGGNAGDVLCSHRLGTWRWGSGNCERHRRLRGLSPFSEGDLPFPAVTGERRARRRHLAPPQVLRSSNTTSSREADAGGSPSLRQCTSVPTAPRHIQLTAAGPSAGAARRCRPQRSMCGQSFRRCCQGRDRDANGVVKSRLRFFGYSGIVALGFRVGSVRRQGPRRPPRPGRHYKHRQRRAHGRLRRHVLKHRGIAAAECDINADVRPSAQAESRRRLRIAQRTGRTLRPVARAAVAIGGPSADAPPWV